MIESKHVHMFILKRHVCNWLNNKIYTVEDCKWVFWSAECAFYFYNYDTGDRIYSKRNESFHETYVQCVCSVQTQGASVKFWECFPYFDFYGLVEINMTLNPREYIQFFTTVYHFTLGILVNIPLWTNICFGIITVT